MSTKSMKPSISIKTIHIKSKPRTCANSPISSPTSTTSKKSCFGSSNLIQSCQIKPIEEENFKTRIRYLYNNKAFLSPTRYATKGLVTHGQMGFWERFSSPEDKRALYKSLFKSWYCDDRKFLKRLTIFHDHFSRLCSSVYPYNVISKEYQEQKQ